MGSTRGESRAVLASIGLRWEYVLLEATRLLTWQNAAVHRSRIRLSSGAFVNYGVWRAATATTKIMRFSKNRAARTFAVLLHLSKSDGVQKIGSVIFNNGEIQPQPSPQACEHSIRFCTVKMQPSATVAAVYVR